MVKIAMHRVILVVSLLVILGVECDALKKGEPGVCMKKFPPVKKNPNCVRNCKVEPAKLKPICCDGFLFDQSKGHCKKKCDHIYQNNVPSYLPDGKQECAPKCSSFCPNGTCTGIEMCTCNKGYRNPEGRNSTCVPLCEQDCVNGWCSGVNNCTCISGFVSTEENPNICFEKVETTAENDLSESEATTEQANTESPKNTTEESKSTINDETGTIEFSTIRYILTDNPKREGWGKETEPDTSQSSIQWPIIIGVVICFVIVSIIAAITGYFRRKKTATADLEANQGVWVYGGGSVLGECGDNKWDEQCLNKK